MRALFAMLILSIMVVAGGATLTLMLYLAGVFE